MNKRTYLVCIMALLFMAPAVASTITPVIMAVSPNSPISAVEGETITFEAYIDNRDEHLPLTVSWLYDGVEIQNETLISDGAVYCSLVVEAGTHEVMLVVTAEDKTTATHEWTIVSESPSVATLYGTVFMEDSVVPKALIRVKNSMEDTVTITKTEVNGGYSIELPAGMYTVSAQYRGLKSETFLVVVDEDVLKDIWLQPKVKV